MFAKRTKYYVRSGDHRDVFVASDPEAAAERFVVRLQEQNRGKHQVYIGRFIQVSERGYDEFHVHDDKIINSEKLICRLLAKRQR